MNYDSRFLTFFAIFMLINNLLIHNGCFLRQEVPFKGLHLAYELEGKIIRSDSQTHANILAYVTFKEIFDEYSIADIEVLKLGYRYVCSLKFPSKMNTLFYLREDPNLDFKKDLEFYTGTVGKDLLFINYKLPYDEAIFIYNRTVTINLSSKDKLQVYELIYLYESFEEDLKVKAVLYYDCFTRILVLSSFVLDAKDRRIEGVMSLKETNAFNQKFKEETFDRIILVQLLTIISILALSLIIGRKVFLKTGVGDLYAWRKDLAQKLQCYNS
ncbi:MAG: hypothetical protein QXG01_03990 [Candidatus Bathyarchaeia archaeon]